MTIRVEPYKKEHSLEIIKNLRDEDKWLESQDWTFVTEAWECFGPSFSIFDDDKVIFSCGIVLSEFNNGEAWTLFSKEYSKYKKTVFQKTKQILEDLISGFNLKRVSATCSDSCVHRRFLERLGFVYEGTLKSFGPDNEDLVVYGRVV